MYGHPDAKKCNQYAFSGIASVLSNSHRTERMSQFVDYHFQLLVHELPSFVKDTNDFF